jgi:hypothetical protein
LASILTGKISRFEAAASRTTSRNDAGSNCLSMGKSSRLEALRKENEELTAIFVTILKRSKES